MIKKIIYMYIYISTKFSSPASTYLLVYTVQQISLGGVYYFGVTAVALCVTHVVSCTS